MGFVLGTPQFIFRGLAEETWWALLKCLWEQHDTVSDGDREGEDFRGEVARFLTRRFEVLPSRVTTGYPWWVTRNWLRQAYREEQTLPDWVLERLACADLDVLIRTSPHISMKQPHLMAYTQNDTKGEGDYQTVASPGRFLQQYFGHALSADAIRTLATHLSPPQSELRLARTEDEIERVYTVGPESCMHATRMDGDRLRTPYLPVRVWARCKPPLAVAYMEDGDGRITARTLADPERKTYLRIFGDETRLRLLLEREQYSQSSDMLNNREVRLDWYDEKVVFPYMDGGSDDVYTDYIGCDTGVIENTRGGPYRLTPNKYPGSNPDGYARLYDEAEEDDDRVTCGNCGELYHEEDEGGPVIVSNYITEQWCGECFSESTTTVVDSRSPVSYRFFRERGGACGICEDRYIDTDDFGTVRLRDGESTTEACSSCLRHCVEDLHDDVYYVDDDALEAWGKVEEDGYAVTPAEEEDETEEEEVS
jgi:hypothetical protein